VKVRKQIRGSHSDKKKSLTDHDCCTLFVAIELLGGSWTADYSELS
jgi:hypothetical protein